MLITRNSALRRKLAQNRPERETGHVSPVRAFEYALSRAGLNCLKLPLAVSRLAETPLGVDGMANRLPNRALSFFLEADGAARGVVSLDPDCLNAIVQAVTIGLIPSQMTEPRLPTLTDAELCRRFVTELTAAFTSRIEGHPAEPSLRGAVPGARLSGAGQIAVALPAMRYREFSATLSFANGVASGVLSLTVPWDLSRPLETKMEGGQTGTRSWSDTLRSRVLDSAIRMEAVLCRTQQPLSRVAAMKPGDSLLLPTRALQNVRLETIDGAEVGQWRLGQADGHRALRLSVVAGHSEALRFPQDMNQKDEDQAVEPSPQEEKDLPLAGVVLPAAE